MAQSRVGVFGGTFDPVHLGHLIIAEELRVRLDLETVLFLPANHPPHKVEQDVASIEDRLLMLQLAIDRNPHFRISYHDAASTQPSFTAETLEALARDVSPHPSYFLMGQDSLRDFPNWHEPGRIARAARLGVALRPGAQVDVETIVTRVPEARGRIQLVNVPLIQIASRILRERLRDGLPIRYQVPRDVEAYIFRRGLYGAGKTNSGPPPAL